jgi:glycosyltransferase involved in cell wall biosynthesis
LEASNIEDVLTAIPPVVHGLAVSVLVVIDGGNDGTEEIVANVGAMSASLPVNLGQGRALRLGYELASTHGARYVVTIDADGQNDSKEIPDHLAPLMTDEADVVIASRKLGVDEFSGAMRQFGVKLFARIISRLSRQRVTDSTNSFRAFKIEVLQSLTLEQDQYQTAEMILSIAAQGWRIAEVPTVRRLRASGESKKVLGAESSARSLRLFLGANSYFGLQYTRVIALTWWRERRNLRCRASEPFPRS